MFSMHMQSQPHEQEWEVRKYPLHSRAESNYTPTQYSFTMHKIHSKFHGILLTNLSLIILSQTRWTEHTRERTDNSTLKIKLTSLSLPLFSCDKSHPAFSSISASTVCPAISTNTTLIFFFFTSLFSPLNPQKSLEKANGGKDVLNLTLQLCPLVNNGRNSGSTAASVFESLFFFRQTVSEMLSSEQISFRVYVNVTNMQKCKDTQAINTKNLTYNTVILISAQSVRHSMAN